MRLLNFALLFGLINYTPSYGNFKIDSIPKAGNGVATFQFKDSDTSTVYVTSSSTAIKNVIYSEQHLNKDNEFQDYIVKQTQTIATNNMGGQYLNIKLDFYQPSTGKLIKTISKSANSISFFPEYIHSTSYYDEDYHEFSTIWTDETFLRFNSKYYLIEIPNSHINFYLGYLNDSRSEKTLELGKLFLAHSLPNLPKGKIFKPVNTIIFKAKSKEFFDKTNPFTPTMTLVKTVKDQLIDYPDHQELRLWSFDYVRNLMGVDFIGLKIQFQRNSTSWFEVPIKNGLLFGDESKELVIYVDK